MSSQQCSDCISIEVKLKDITTLHYNDVIIIVTGRLLSSDYFNEKFLKILHTHYSERTCILHMHMHTFLMATFKVNQGQPVSTWVFSIQ